jgi:hypothetical protein
MVDARMDVIHPSNTIGSVFLVKCLWHVTVTNFERLTAVERMLCRDIWAT